MSDYIKREDAIRQIVKTSAQNELDIPAIGTVIYILSEMDSADVRENIHAKKIISGGDHDGATCWFECSHCHGSVNINDAYCKHCGAVLEYEK